LTVLIQNVKASPIHLILCLRSICRYNTTQYNAMTPTFLFQNSSPNYQTSLFAVMDKHETPTALNKFTHQLNVYSNIK
jgi:hypothetical protein